jgi:hypothetical protein
MKISGEIVSFCYFVFNWMELNFISIALITANLFIVLLKLPKMRQIG